MISLSLSSTSNYNNINKNNIKKQTLVDGKKVVFPGFGTFEPRPRNARKGRNPKTGDEIDIAASIGAGFSPAKALKDKLNGRE